MRFKQFLKESLADRHALNQENKKRIRAGQPPLTPQEIKEFLNRPVTPPPPKSRTCIVFTTVDEMTNDRDPAVLPQTTLLKDLYLFSGLDTKGIAERLLFLVVPDILAHYHQHGLVPDVNLLKQNPTTTKSTLLGPVDPHAVNDYVFYTAARQRLPLYDPQRPIRSRHHILWVATAQGNPDNIIPRLQTLVKTETDNEVPF